MSVNYLYCSSNRDNLANNNSYNSQGEFFKVTMNSSVTHAFFSAQDTENQGS